MRVISEIAWECLLMPIYVYRCPKCRKRIEAIQKLNDPPPLCCGVVTEKEMGASNFALKGGGWERDGYS